MAESKLLFDAISATLVARHTAVAGGWQTGQTAEVQFLHKGKVVKESDYCYIAPDTIYDLVDARKPNKAYNFDNCYIEDFSLTTYRTQKGLPDGTAVDLFGFTARNSIFNGGTDFSHAVFCESSEGFEHTVFAGHHLSFVHAQFGDEDESFADCHFLCGNVSFHGAHFGKGDVDFRGAVFGDGRKDFERVNFGEGELNFSNVHFGAGDVSFGSISTQRGRVSFAGAQFGRGKIDFKSMKLGAGELLFERTNFGEGDVSFRSAQLNNGKIDYTGARFGDGKIDFTHTQFSDGNIVFLRTTFDRVKISFKIATMGRGNLDFHYAKFIESEVIFERADLGDGLLDFRAAEFDRSRMKFHNSQFGDGDADFEAIEIRSGKLIFEDCSFGKGMFKFETAKSVESDVVFHKIDFGNKDISFKGAFFSRLQISACQLNNFVDLRVARCGSLMLTDCIVRDILDLRTDQAPVKLDSLDLSSMRLLGRIYIDWNGSNVKELIYRQKTTDKSRSEQFRMLKQNFNTIGNYKEEDEAYVEFKRTEAKAIRARIIEEAKHDRQTTIRRYAFVKNLKSQHVDNEESRTQLLAMFRKIRFYKINDAHDLKFSLMRGFQFDKETARPYTEIIEKMPVAQLLEQKSKAMQLLTLPAYTFQYVKAKVNYWAQFIIFDKIGLYATDPIRVLFSMVLVYIIFSLVYVVLPVFEGADIISSLFPPDDPRQLSPVGRAFYHSAITFLTIGYGDYYPSGVSRVMSALEGFTGLFLMSYFTVAFVRKILR